MQAARGASLIPAADDGPADRASDPTTGLPPDGEPVAGRSSPGPRRLLLLGVIAAVAYALDVTTKIVAVARLDGSSNVELVGPWLTLTLVRNPGAAFSTGTGFTEVLSVVSITAALVVLWVARRVRSTGWAVGLGLLLAGVLGNLTDRMLRQPGPFQGHVIDFLRLPNWPVFNVADMCINVAAALILVQAFRGIRVDGTREGEHRDTEPATDTRTETGGDDDTDASADAAAGRDAVGRDDRGTSA